MDIHNTTRGTRLAWNARLAVSGRERRRGLTGRAGMEDGEALVFKRCRQVHTFGMRFPIDVVFLDSSGRIVRACRGLSPLRVSPLVWCARTVIELPAGTLARTGSATGDEIEINCAEQPRSSGGR